jgi:hypothetical protein
MQTLEGVSLVRPFIVSLYGSPPSPTLVTQAHYHDKRPVLSVYTNTGSASKPIFSHPSSSVFDGINSVVAQYDTTGGSSPTFGYLNGSVSSLSLVVGGDDGRLAVYRYAGSVADDPVFEPVLPNPFAHVRGLGGWVILGMNR